MSRVFASSDLLYPVVQSEKDTDILEIFVPLSNLVVNCDGQSSRNLLTLFGSASLL